MRLLTLLAAIAGPASHAQQEARPAKAGSSIVKVEVVTDTPVGQFGGRAYRRITGVIHGLAATDEPVAGLR